MTNWKRWISLVLAAVMCLSCTGCFDIDSYLPSTQESTGSGLSTYQITVRTHSGRYLEGIGVRVFADPGKTDLVWYDKTDATGTMTFTADTFDGYVVALENIPDGYAAAEYYPLTGIQNEIVLSIGLQTGVDLNTIRLHPGDTMVNLAVAASDGKEYDLSKLLTSKKAVALCFFDSGSAEDLSTVQAAWADYADEVTVLALDPVDPDVSAFTAGLQLPAAACDSAWISALGLHSFPSMVVVDRYGIISLIHEGHIADPEVYRDVFAFFARNDYEAEVVDKIEAETGVSISEITGGEQGKNGESGGLGGLLGIVSGLSGEGGPTNQNIEELKELNKMLEGLGGVTGEENGFEGLIDGAIEANKDAEAANDGWPKTLRAYPGGTATATASYRTEISGTTLDEMLGWIEDLKGDGFEYQDFYDFGMSEQDMLDMNGWWAYDGNTYLSVSFSEGTVIVDHTKELPDLESYFN